MDGSLSSTIGPQATEGNTQPVQEPTLFAAYLTSICKWHTLSVGGCQVKPTRPGSKILIGDSAASIHCTGDSSFFCDQRFQGPDETFLIIGDGGKIDVVFFGCIDVVMQCEEDVDATQRDVAFVPGVPFDLRLFNVIQDEHVIILDRTGAHMLDGHVLFRKGKVGKYVDATRVAKHEQLPALVTVPALPQPTSSAQPLPQVSPAETRSASRQQAPPVTGPSKSSPEPPLPTASLVQR